MVLDGKGLPHTGSGTVGGNGAGGGVVIDRRAGSIVREARGRLLGVIPGGRRRGRRVARIPIVGATCAGGARMNVPIGRRITGSGVAVRWWRLSEPVECGKREGLVGGAAKDSTLGKSINPRHQSSVSARQELCAHRLRRPRRQSPGGGAAACLHRPPSTDPAFPAELDALSYFATPKLKPSRGEVIRSTATSLISVSRDWPKMPTQFQ